MDGAARAFLSDLEAIQSDYEPRIKAAVATVEELKRAAVESVKASCTIWASQSERPGTIRQAAKVSTMRIEKGEAVTFGMASARAILQSGWIEHEETDADKEQRRRRDMIRKAMK